MGAGDTGSWITKDSLGSKTPESRDDRVWEKGTEDLNGGQGHRIPGLREMQIEGGPDSWILRGRGAGVLGKEGGSAGLVRILGLFQAGGFALESCVSQEGGGQGPGPPNL